jgi:hypothetical protein
VKCLSDGKRGSDPAQFAPGKWSGYSCSRNYFVCFTRPADGSQPLLLVTDPGNERVQVLDTERAGAPAAGHVRDLARGVEVGREGGFIDASPSQVRTEQISQWGSVLHRFAVTGHAPSESPQRAACGSGTESGQCPCGS